MIRRAKLEDAKAIYELDSLMFVDSLGLEFIENDLGLNNMAYYYVAVEDEKIVGYISSWISDNTTILDFCVLPEYQKRGIGSALIEEVFKQAKGMITLEVRESNQNAINFYLNKGFKGSLIRYHYYSNGENAILMIRK